MTLFKLALVAFIYSISTISIASNVDGKLSTYYDSGSKLADKIYKDGVPIGTWKSWYENGNSHSITKFLDNTGQIEKINAFYESGALLYSGVATINTRKDDKGMLTKVSKCSARIFNKGDGSKWHNKYELNISSFYEDGSCEDEEKFPDNIHRVLAQIYFKISDKSTENVYDFPWHRLWGTVPKFLRERELDSK